MSNRFDNIEPHRHLPPEVRTALWDACQLVVGNPGDFAEAVKWLDSEFSESATLARALKASQGQYELCMEKSPNGTAQEIQEERNEYFADEKKTRDNKAVEESKQKWERLRLAMTEVKKRDLAAGGGAIVNAKRVVLVACLLSWDEIIPAAGDFGSWAWSNEGHPASALFGTGKFVPGREYTLFNSWVSKSKPFDAGSSLIAAHIKFANLVGRAVEVLRANTEQLNESEIFKLNMEALKKAPHDLMQQGQNEQPAPASTVTELASQLDQIAGEWHANRATARTHDLRAGLAIFKALEAGAFSPPSWSDMATELHAKSDFQMVLGSAQVCFHKHGGLALEKLDNPAALDRLAAAFRVGISNGSGDSRSGNGGDAPDARLARAKQICNEFTTLKQENVGAKVETLVMEIEKQHVNERGFKRSTVYKVLRDGGLVTDNPPTAADAVACDLGIQLSKSKS